MGSQRGRGCWLGRRGNRGRRGSRWRWWLVRGVVDRDVADQTVRRSHMQPVPAILALREAVRNGENVQRRALWVGTKPIARSGAAPQLDALPVRPSNPDSLSDRGRRRRGGRSWHRSRQRGCRLWWRGRGNGRRCGRSHGHRCGRGLLDLRRRLGSGAWMAGAGEQPTALTTRSRIGSPTSRPPRIER